MGVSGRAEGTQADGEAVCPVSQEDDIAKMKRIRNAIAHRSDKAWDSFISLVNATPFLLTSYVTPAS